MQRLSAASRTTMDDSLAVLTLVEGKDGQTLHNDDALLQQRYLAFLTMLADANLGHLFCQP